MTCNCCIAPLCSHALPQYPGEKRHAAFRQGIAVMHGCKEGQCSSCKSLLIEGDVEMKKYSTFALPDYERESHHILLCRTLAFSDLTVELLNYDEDLMRRSIA